MLFYEKCTKHLSNISFLKRISILKPYNNDGKKPIRSLVQPTHSQLDEFAHSLSHLVWFYVSFVKDGFEIILHCLRTNYFKHN